MKKTLLILIIIEIVIVIIFLRFACVFFINERFLINYRKEKYNINSIKILAFANFSESYIYHYNQGNLFYKNGKYKEAINEYYKALEKYIPKGKECSIRINLALAKIATIEDINSEEDRQKNIDTLLSARNVLCEKGCANSNDNNGHSEEAEKLKQDIDKLLEKLQNPDKNEEEKEENKQQQEEEKKEKKDENDKKKEELKKRQKEAIQERQKEIEEDENLWKNTGVDSYYDGKKW